MRITAQLSDVASGFQLWSERYDSELKDSWAVALDPGYFLLEMDEP